ncbi:MAG TPA: M48 family metalloprotease [bacterium]|nr:M48 family metalloprotease [bacterium]
MRLTVLGLLLLLLASPVLRAAPADEAEIRLGREYARRLEARYPVVTDEAAVEPVTRIGRQIAALSERPYLPWTFKVIEFAEPNAVALPGGFVYVTRPMLTFVRSEHELAAVLAHEVAHIAHRHQMEMIRRSNQAAFWTILIAVLTRDPQVASGAQLVSYGLLSGYTRELERDADLTALAYLTKTPYTPVAALTLMERLQREERYRPRVDPGDLRDHPKTEERVAYLTAELRRMGIPLVRRPAAGYLRIATRTVTEQGRVLAELYVNDTLIVRLADPARIAAAAAAMDRFFDQDPDPGQVAMLRVGETYEIVGGQIPLLVLRPADAAALGAPLGEAALRIHSRLRVVIAEDRRRRQFSG